MANTKLAITNKTGQVLIITSLPDYSKFDTAGWVAMLCDEDKTNTTDPTPTGDYLYKEFCTIDRTAKTLTFAGGVNLTAWQVGDNLVLYNCFLNYTFVGNQTVGPLINISGAPAWRGYYTVGGGIFKNDSTGHYIWFFTGYTTATPHIGAIGYAWSTDMINWTVGNSDTPIFNASTLPDGYSVSTTGSIYHLNDGTGRYYCLIAYQKNANHSKNITVLLYFDPALTTFTFSASLLDETPDGGCVGSSIVKINGYYHMSYSIQYAIDRNREQRVAKSLLLEGPYVDYQLVAVGTGSNDGVQWSWSADGFSIFNDGLHIFGLFGGFSEWSLSGGKGNRFFCLVNYKSGVWTVDKSGPVIINPLYYYDLNATYGWADDHTGGYPSIFVNGSDVYMSLTMHGRSTGVYQMALIKLNYL